MASKAAYVAGFAAAAYGIYYVLSQKNVDPQAPTKKHPVGGDPVLPKCNPGDPYYPTCKPPPPPPKGSNTYQISTVDFPRTGFCGINRMWLPPADAPFGTVRIPLITWAPDMNDFDDSLEACLGRQEPRDAAAKYHAYGNGFWDSSDYPSGSVVWVTPNPYWEGDPGLNVFDSSYPEPPPQHGCYWMSAKDGSLKHTACGYIVPAGTPDQWISGPPVKTLAEWWAESSGGWS